MVHRRDCSGIVEAGERDVDGLRRFVELKGQLRAAAWAELAESDLGRIEARGSAFDESEICGAKSGPGNKCRTAGSPADFTVAVGFVGWFAGGAIADSS